MRRNLIPVRALAIFLSFSLALPGSAHALRQSGLEESNAKEQFLDEIQSPSTAGMDLHWLRAEFEGVFPVNGLFPVAAGVE